jgi:hypothetical protein
MPMDNPSTANIQPNFHPSISQEDRGAKMRRFNFLYIYLPIGFAALVILALTILLLIMALGVGSAATLATLSGMADSVIILAIIPTMILCAIVPFVYLAVVFQTRSRGRAPIQQSQRMLWRVQDRLESVTFRVASLMSIMREPFIRISARYAFIKHFLIRIVSLFYRR